MLIETGLLFPMNLLSSSFIVYVDFVVGVSSRATCVDALIQATAFVDALIQETHDFSLKLAFVD
jgi:hypothetical protein